MKKKRFYNNKNRNQKWTEEPQGRKLAFADKYAEGESSDKFDSKRPKQENYGRKTELTQKRLKAVILVAFCLFFLLVGYIGADVRMIRHETAAKIALRSDERQEAGIAQAKVSFSACSVQSMSLDGSVMLDAVMQDCISSGHSSLAFEAKRSDGTIGYASSLAMADTYNAVSFEGKKPKESVKKLAENDILPVAEICCYRDNVIPANSKQMAVLKDGKLYKDSGGNTYLNPDSSAVYNYIKNIIQELKDCGISVFVLRGCDLPKDISGKYNGGYNALAAKLSSDLGSEVKLIDGVDIEINNADDIKKIQKLNDGQAYVVKTKLPAKTVFEKLKNKGISAYIINEVK